MFYITQSVACARALYHTRIVCLLSLKFRKIAVEYVTQLSRQHTFNKSIVIVFVFKNLSQLIAAPIINDIRANVVFVLTRAVSLPFR